MATAVTGWESRVIAVREHLQQPINKVLPPSLLLYLIPPIPPLRYLVGTLLLLLLLLVRIWCILPARRSSRLQHSIPVKAEDKHKNTRNPSSNTTIPNENGFTVAVFLGSGGHTTELIQLVSALPTSRYPRRKYLVSSGDNFSLDKAGKLESLLLASSSTTRSSSASSPSSSAVLESKPKYPASSADPSSNAIQVLQIPRARNVHQSFLTTPITLVKSIAFCIFHIALRPLLLSLLPGLDKHKPSSGDSPTNRNCNRNRIYADLVLMNGPGTCVPIVIAVYCLRILGLESPKLIYIESFARVKSLSLTAKLVRPLVDRFVLQWPASPTTSTPTTTTTSATNKTKRHTESRTNTKQNAENLTELLRRSNTVYSGWLV
ncbi:Alg14-domain-containing protein [Testicularia cyperi]|uniref:UDP-N-acetylglucosamine transferase subunit ALG14 n=1 Tax=Testicularia cyperi TaxID=1882483 RepID=A0A317XPJ4_9BASI|nr:Alg14-domain-containing protein [Testicularia cyperi]